MPDSLEISPDRQQEVALPENNGPTPDEIREMIKKKTKNSKWMSWLLDECIRIPGTNIRFGLDPIIGLIPVGGDFTATLMGALVLTEAGRRGIPFKTLGKMGGNMIVNAGLGAIPGLGDLFSVWFKSNSRNHKLLREFLESEDGREAKGGWWPILLILAVVGVVLVINLAITIAILKFTGIAVSYLQTPPIGG